MSIVNRVVEGYRDIMDNKSDPRVKDWPLMSSPWPTIWLCLVYTYWVKVIGPQYMRNRKPYELRTLIVLYNFAQTIFSCFMFIQSSSVYIMHGYSFRCQPVNYANTPEYVKVAILVYAFYIGKFVDFIDTVFFVLRKKSEHVSMLHVLHHASVPLTLWIMVKFVPGGHSMFAGILNSGVHTLMYGYYMLAAMGPQFQKYLWWKKYLTIVQLVQFILLIVHNFQLFFIPCDYPMFVVWYIGVNAMFFFVLFMNFYLKAYRKKATLKVKEKSAKDNTLTNGQKVHVQDGVVQRKPAAESCQTQTERNEQLGSS